jgi:hypothetical protein
MADPERHRQQAHISTSQPDLEAALTKIDHQLEQNEANENPIERFQTSDELWEKRDELEVALREKEDAGTLPTHQ